MKKIFNFMRESRRVLLMAAVLVLTSGFSYRAGLFIGGHEFYNDKDGKTVAYSKDDLLVHERRYCGAALELLHKFYGNDDNEFWFDVVQNLPEYKAMEQENGGDWEDFYTWQELPLNAENYYCINGEIYILDEEGGEL